MCYYIMHNRNKYYIIICKARPLRIENVIIEKQKALRAIVKIYAPVA